MGIVDCHAHIFNPVWYPVVFQKCIARDYLKMRRKEISDDFSEGYRRICSLITDCSGEATLRIMDRAGIEKRVIHVIDWGVELGEPELKIGDIHKEILGICSKHYDRLIGFAGIDPRRPDAKQVIRYAFDDLGARGLKLHPTSSAWTLADESVSVLVEIAADRHLPVMIHCGRTFDPLSGGNCQPLDLIRLAREWPSASFIAGHSGFEQWGEFVKSPEEIPSNLFFDISGWQTMGPKEAILREMVELLTKFEGRVFFGTDSPFTTFNFSLLELSWIALAKSAADKIGPEKLERFLSCDLV